MSTTPNRRSHEEGGNGSAGGSGSHIHSSSTKFQHEESGSYPSMIPKPTSSTSVDYHHPNDMGSDSRMPKLPRIESRDADRRSPLLPMFRVSSSSNEAHSDRVTSFESRSEFRDTKDGNKEPKVESRDTKVEPRDMYQGSRLDKDVKFESRGDDNKEIKHERESHQEHRADVRMEKEGFSGAGSHGNWKSPMEQHRGKRYPDTSAGTVDPWNASRSSSRTTAEGINEAPNLEERDYVEAHEAVGENKVDFKWDDKLKEKERKRKEGKHRDWGEREKDKNERRSTMQVCTNSSNDTKELMREERESERSEKERKDFAREKENVKDKDKEYSKKESGSGAKEVPDNDKEVLDVPSRVTDPENPSLDIKKPKDVDSWKSADRDPRDRKRERDADDEGERADKRNKNHDKDSDDGCVEADGADEKEREAFNYGVQQRKRMLRPRGSPQRTNRDPRFRSRNQDNEGFQGKPDTSSILYRVAECLQELTKVWKEFQLTQTDKKSESSSSGPTLDIRIPAEHVSTANRQVRGGQLWGTDIYTDDSDLVAVLMHTGFCRPTASPPDSTIQELRVTIRVLPPQECYISTLRNNVRSRSWGAAIGCSYRVERCCVVKKGGAMFDLQPCLTHSSSLEPTLAPVAVERTMTTRAAASNALRQQRFVREVTVQFNLCGEPWLKYSVSVVADKGLKRPLYTSSRLKKGEVLFLETHSCRYELCFAGEKMVKATPASLANEAESDRSQHHNSHSTNGERGCSVDTENVVDAFRWSRCKKILPQSKMISVGIPLPPEHVEVLADNLDWEDINWTPVGVHITGKEYSLARAHFMSPN
ncbi:OLC1v1008558C1 [Oldenlandia corymbosa var. corymbosa]|uniref:OLC1v1008558C1 n=1 Tax=Oldenlandia corymbosa var. corymbosa TaxID=529605 RepID=A0AAV1DQ47_OLDCO|nr:OLC1v1008558C1 [Oldenlandia corymbosa var. corymbosa]